MSWVCHSNSPGCRLFVTFDSLYKGFKGGFFWACSMGDLLNFFLDKEGNRRFPLYWTSDLSSLVHPKYDKFSDLERGEVEELNKLPTLRLHRTDYLGQ